MRTAFGLFLVFFAGLAGCAPVVGNSLDWQESSFRRVTANAPRYGDARLAFASEVSADGLAKEWAVQQFAIEVRGFPEQATVSFRCLRDFRAAVWFRGFDPEKLKVDAASLTDNRGHTFKLSRVRPSYGCAAELAIDRKENAYWMEFNNRDYYVTLTVKFTYDGREMTASFPNIYCVFAKFTGT
jgi:hypothetical protein